MSKVQIPPSSRNPELLREEVIAQPPSSDDALCAEAIALARIRQRGRYIWMALQRRPHLGPTMARMLSLAGLELADVADAIAKRYGLPGSLVAA